MTIGRLTCASAIECKDINNLLVQMREESTEHATTVSELKKIVADANIVVIVAQDKGKIAGMATLYILQKLGKRIGRIEDVVVDSAYRGQGLGRSIMEKVIATARARKVTVLRVDSRPVHVVANKLYPKLGFKIKKTNPYRMVL